MINDEVIKRINELAKKAKSPEGLTEKEIEERAKLRKLYVEAVRESLRGHLDVTYFVDEKGNKTKLKKKGTGAS